MRRFAERNLCSVSYHVSSVGSHIYVVDGPLGCTLQQTKSEELNLQLSRKEKSHEEAKM